MHVDFIANDWSTVQTYFKRLHILDLGFIMYKRLTIFLSFELWKCVIAYIIMLEIPMMNTWH